MMCLKIQKDDAKIKLIVKCGNNVFVTLVGEI